MDEAMNNVPEIKIEPHLLVEVFRVASEARTHLNESLANDETDDVLVDPQVVEFFIKLIEQHPDPEVRAWFVNELKSLMEGGGS